jgi:hypothetical protein
MLKRDRKSFALGCNEQQQSVASSLQISTTIDLRECQAGTRFYQAASTWPFPIRAFWKTFLSLKRMSVTDFDQSPPAN